jgi:hypothetical protein
MHNVFSTADTARAMSDRYQMSQNFEEVHTTLAAMIDAGYRYQNLEKSIGMGIALVLGRKLSET